MAEQGKKTATKSSQGKKTIANGDKSREKNHAKRQTTYMPVKNKRFGDSITDEIILILVILVSVVVFISMVTEKMGIIGHIFGMVFKGILGIGGVILPILVILYCIWMLASKERKWMGVRVGGGILFLLTIAAAAHLMHPPFLREGAGFFGRCAAFYCEGAVSNGGLVGGLVGTGLYRLLDTLGSVLVLVVSSLISVILMTGRSFFSVIGGAADHHKERKRMKQEYRKSQADHLRHMEQKEAEREIHRVQKEQKDYEEKTAAKRKAVSKDFNFEIEEEPKEKIKPQRVEETVFRSKRPDITVVKPRDPIYDFVKETAQPYADEAELSKTEGTEEEIPIVMASSHGTEATPFAEDTFVEISAEERAATAEEVQEAEASMAKQQEIPEEQVEGQSLAEQSEGISVQAKKPYVFPPIDLLGRDTGRQGNDGKAEMIANAKKLESTLKSFGVDARVVQINKGPTVTRYEVSPNQGVKVSKIVNLADDIALNLAASGIRIEAPIPGKAAVGIEVPNKETQSVYLRTVLESDAFKEHPSKLAFALGEDIAGEPVVTDIAKMPHLLIAGATGSGKSVCINTLITSILYKANPNEVKLLMVDPKVVELSVYNGIPHLLIPVVTDPKKASAALNWAVREMLQRYNDFAAYGVRDMKGFNAMKEEQGEPEAKMPQIVIIIDELADLMMAAPGEVEDSICRLAQMARAAGMHLIIATQRPSVDVITGVIKANIPSRLAFAVSSGIDSRTILDMVGAEKLLGKGDMLFYPSGQGKPARMQGAFVTDKEVENIVDFLKKTGKPNYTQEMVEHITSSTKTAAGNEEEMDEFYIPAVELILEKEKASVSMLQRQFRIGYNRAARLMDELERHGMVGQEEGSKPRKVLLTKQQWEEMQTGGTEREHTEEQ